MLDDLDKELEKRVHRCVRYADDCNIYVKSERAGQRVMEGVTDFIERKLKLRVNREKSAVARPGKRSFLGFSFTSGQEPRRRIAPKSLKRLKTRIRELTRRTRGASLEHVVAALSPFLRGWVGYYGFCETPSVLKGLDAWIRRRLRSYVWKQWSHARGRYAGLKKRGLDPGYARLAAGAGGGNWRRSHSIAMSKAFPTAYFASLGLPLLYRDLAV